MTKIMLLYKSRDMTDTFYSAKIKGGIEKFARQLGEVIDNIIPIVIDPESRVARKTKQMITAALSKHDPDVVISNDIDNLYTNYVAELGYKTISIIHEPRSGDIRFVDLGKRLLDLHELGGHIYFVSNPQFQYHSDMCQRLHGKPLNPPHGIIPSSYCGDHFFLSSEINFAAGTLGRTDVLKDPFALHKKMQGSGLTSLVLTDTFVGSKENGPNEKYQNANQHWKDPQITMRDLGYQENMRLLSQMGCYVSTCSVESWGITALESLASGVPFILLTDSTGVHSSEDIPVSPDHYIKLRKNCSKEDFVEAVKKLNKITNRKEIADATKSFHSKERWKSIVDEIINRRLDDKMSARSDISEFFV